MKRVLTGAVLISLVFGLIWANVTWLTAAFSAVLAVFAGLEFRSLTARAESPVPVWWLVLSTLAMLAPAFGWINDPLALAGVLAILLFGVNAFTLPLTRVLPATGAGLLFLLYIAFPLSLIPRILAVEDGTALLLFLFLCVWCGDIAALYVGKAFGRRKLAPALSPNKTWEGSLASVAGSVVFGVGLVLLGNFLTAHNSSFTRLHTRWPWWQFLLLATLLNIAAQIGDLAESALKRAVDVKDSGTLLPGHGGVLDRVDALLFAAPVLWLVLAWHTVM